MQTIGSILLVIAALGFPATANAIDLHEFWDQRCAECHGHAGAFAREHLSVHDGALRDRHHTTTLRTFLAQHQMGPEHADAIYTMLLAQAQTGPVYQQKCAGCHDTAASFTRSSVALRDGVLIGVKNGKPVLEFLSGHGGATATEAKAIVESLTRILGEVGPTVR
jgi:mono/diheme cytochrome c family protein